MSTVSVVDPPTDSVEGDQTQRIESVEVTKEAGSNVAEVNKTDKVPGVIEEKENAEKVCDIMLEKVADYLRGELSATSEDYRLLETLNKMTISKYQDMSETSKKLIQNMEALNDKYKALQPYLDQVDQLEDSVQKLEQAAYKLDAYSKQLETKFKKIERR